MYDFNDGFPRMAKICMTATSANLSDTIYLKQKGVKTPTFKLAKPNMTVHGYGGEVRAELDMNVDIKDLHISVDYTSDEAAMAVPDKEDGWVRDITYENGFLIIQTDPNPGRTRQYVLLPLIWLTLTVGKSKTNNNFSSCKQMQRTSWALRFRL